MYASLADRSTRKLLKYLARVDVLLIDEMGYLNQIGGPSLRTPSET